MKPDGLTKNTGIIIGIFSIIQVFSFLGYVFPFLENILFILIFVGCLFFSWKKIEYGFLFLFAEFFIGHQGHLFEFFGISLRLSLFLLIMAVWLIKKIKEKELRKMFDYYLKSEGLGIFLIFLFVIFLGLCQGIIKQNSLLAIKDFINYSYLFLVFPFIDILKKKKVVNNFFRFAQAGTVVIAILTLIVFVLFASGLAEVHGQFYWWWRGTVMGKVTDVGNNFFRVVSSAHVLILPLFLIYLSLFFTEGKNKLKKKIKNKLLILLFLSSLVLIINFSRGYFLGILAGLLFFKKGVKFKLWLKFSIITIAVLMLEFVLIFGLVSGGKIWQGFDFFQGRMKTVMSPEEEISSLTRMEILPHLIRKIKKDPLFGQGLGATISFSDRVTFQEKTTFHLDWGYLEIWHELGLFGLISYGLILFYVFYLGFKNIKKFKITIFQKRLIMGLLAGLLSLMVANLTAPVLFHSLGIFYLVFILSLFINLEKNETKISCPDSYLE